jgi:hypothetical protein
MIQMKVFILLATILLLLVLAEVAESAPGPKPDPDAKADHFFFPLVRWRFGPFYGWI